jgi:hypothetical protein
VVTAYQAVVYHFNFFVIIPVMPALLAGTYYSYCHASVLLAGIQELINKILKVTRCQLKTAGMT